MTPTSHSVGLALSGGAARGLAHIGILRRFEEAGIRPDCLAASSAGAIVGALYASGVSLQAIQDIAWNLKWTDLFRSWPTFSSVLSSKGLAQVLHKHCRVTRFEELQTPLAIVATDFETGASVSFTRGDLIPAVQASASIPLLLPPVRIEGRYYIDGGVTQELPVQTARALGADIVVACDVHHNAARLKRPTHFLALAVHLGRMIATLNMEAVKPDADLVIEVDAHDIGLTELRKVEELIRRGRQAAEAILPELLARRGE